MSSPHSLKSLGLSNVRKRQDLFEYTGESQCIPRAIRVNHTLGVSFMAREHAASGKYFLLENARFEREMTYYRDLHRAKDRGRG